jgi:hypothetical protein
MSADNIDIEIDTSEIDKQMEELQREWRRNTQGIIRAVTNVLKLVVFAHASNSDVDEDGNRRLKK